MLTMKKYQIKSTNIEDVLYGVSIGPSRTIHGYIQIVQDRNDYIDRYIPMMEWLASNGYVVFGIDRLGQGKSVASLEELGHIGGNKSNIALVDDENLIFQRILIDYPPQLDPKEVYFKGNKVYINRPILRCMLGLGYGNVIIRNYLFKFKDCNALISVGDVGFPDNSRKVLKYASELVRNNNKRSVDISLEELIEGNFNKQTKNPSSRFAYRLTNQKQAKELSDNKLVNYYYDVFSEQCLYELMNKFDLNQWLSVYPKYLPLYLIAGYDDSVSNYTHLTDEILQRFRLSNAKNVFFKYFKNCRHDLLFEKHKESIWHGIFDYLESVYQQQVQVYESNLALIKAKEKQNVSSND